MSISLKGRVKVPREIKDAVSMGEGFRKAKHLMMFLDDVKKQSKDELRQHEDWLAQHEWVSKYLKKEGAGIIINMPLTALETDPNVLYNVAHYWNVIVKHQKLTNSLDYIERLKRDLEHVAIIDGMDEMSKTILDSNELMALAMQDPADVEEEGETV